jgi:broad specificity phosphatase PhoE
MSTVTAGGPGYLTLICQGVTTATARAAFPVDEPLDDASGISPAPHSGSTPASASWCSPALACRQTADRLSLQPQVEPLLSDCDYGRWKGRRLLDVFATEADAVSQWMTDPHAAPHGGETQLSVASRTRRWLAEHLSTSGHIAAITHTAIIRHALLVVLDAPLQSFWHIDIAPWSRLQLSTNGRRWALRIEA